MSVRITTRLPQDPAAARELLGQVEQRLERRAVLYDYGDGRRELELPGYGTIPVEQVHELPGWDA